MFLRTFSLCLLLGISLVSCGSPDLDRQSAALTSIPSAQTEPAATAPAPGSDGRQPPTQQSATPAIASPTADGQANEQREDATPTTNSSPTGIADLPQPTSSATPIATRPALRATALVPTQPPIPTDSASASPPLDPALQARVDTARADLAQRRSVALETIVLVDVQSVTWPDGSLGCPKPGLAYPQVQVDGLLIRLRIADQFFEYHSGGDRAPFLCDQTSPADKPVPAPDAADN